MTKAIHLLLLAALAVALTACNRNTRSDPPPPVREVHIPVLVPCNAQMPTKPAFAVDVLPLGADIWNQTSALRAERKQRQGYEVELETALRGCIEAPKMEKPP